MPIQVASKPAPTIDAMPRVKAVVSRGQESVGERLARLRKERGVTQAELAERLGVAQPNVSDYERGVLRLNADVIIEVAKLLRVTPNELLGFEDGSATVAPPSSRRLRRRLQEIERLPKRDQQALLRTIDAFLGNADSRRSA